MHQQLSAKQTETNMEDIGSEDYNKKQIFRGIGTLLGIDSNLLADNTPLVEYPCNSFTFLFCIFCLYWNLSELSTFFITMKDMV
jgi:hypothetical protein